MKFPQPKDPAESIVVKFSFPEDVVGTPSVSVSVRWFGVSLDTNPSAMLVGDPQVNGATVLQQVAGGYPLTDYNLRCIASGATGGPYVAAATLMVRTKPTE